MGLKIRIGWAVGGFVWLLGRERGRSGPRLVGVSVW